MEEKIRRAFTTFLLSVCFFQLSRAQQYDFKKYSLTEGLPHQEISTIVQDSSRFMWFGTMGGGLSRFNGSDFKTYTQRNGLRDNYITALLEDSNKNLWVATYRGGVGIIKGDSVVYRFTQTPIDTAVVYNIRESPTGKIWFATDGAGAFVYSGSEIRQLTADSGLTSNTVWDFLFDSGKIWISTKQGATILDNGELKPFEGNANLSGNQIYRIYKGPHGKLWFATNDGVTKYNGSQFNRIKAINGDSLGHVYDIINDKKDNIWIGSASNGIFRQFNGDKFQHITTKNGLTSNYIYNFYKDTKQRIWIASDEAGVDLYRGDNFIRFTKKEALSAEQILSLKKAKNGGLWVGTSNDGLWKISYEHGKFEKQHIGLKGKQVWIVERLKNGHLLLLMGDNRILEYDGASFINYNEKEGLPIPYTIDVFVDSNNGVWIGTKKGVYYIVGNKVHHFTKADGLADNFIWEISESQNGDIWIATNNGISKYDGNTFTNFTTDDGLNQNVISTIVQDEDGDFWIGTTKGVSFYNPQKNDSTAFINFGTKDGMKFVNTQALAFDSKGFLWQATNTSLQRLNVPEFKRTGKMSIANYMYGIDENKFEYAHKAVDKDADGNLWFGAISGLLRYDPHNVEIENTGPKVDIVDILINASEPQKEYITHLNTESSDLSGAVKFNYDQNNISFSYSAIEYKYPEKVQFRYKMNGMLNKWTEPSSQNETVFRKLDPGEYTFQVKARDQQGAWGPVTSFHFSIIPPFWNTYWFYSLLAVSLVGLGYVLIVIKLHKLEKERLQELVEYKTQDLQKALKQKEVLIKEIHHRVKNNLAVITGLLELQMGTADDDFVIHSLQESQRRVRSIAMIHEKLYQNEDLAEIDFKNYVQELLDILTYSLNQGETEVTLNTQIEHVNLGIDQAIPCGLILNELVSNAYEHAFDGTRSGSIQVTFREKKNNVVFIIADDGKGLPKDINEKKLDSLGLTLVDALVQQLDGELELDSSTEGTTYTIIFKRIDESSKLPLN